jgi:transcriptional regulator with XRE-family HTH domain
MNSHDRTRARARGKRTGERDVEPANEGQRLLRAVAAPLGDVAKVCGMHKGTVSAWRTGHKLPCVEARRLLRDAYGIPTDAWGRRPQAAPVAALLVITPERWAEIEAEHAELEREFEVHTRVIPDEVVKMHPLYRDVIDVIVAALPQHRTAVLMAIASVEDTIAFDGWRPERRPTPTPAPAG